MKERNDKSKQNNKSPLKKTQNSKQNNSTKQFGEVAWEGFIPPLNIHIDDKKNSLPSNPKEDTYKSHANGLCSYEIEPKKDTKSSVKEEIQNDKVVLSFKSNSIFPPSRDKLRVSSQKLKKNRSNPRAGFIPSNPKKMTATHKDVKISKGPLRYDKVRDMYFYGKSLDELPPVSSPQTGDEIKDERGNTIGIRFDLGEKK